MLLKELSPGARGRIVALRKEQPEYRRRLLMLGATPGAEFEVVRIAPLGDPVEITVRGYELTLRKADCEKIEVE